MYFLKITDSYGDEVYRVYGDNYENSIVANAYLELPRENGIRYVTYSLNSQRSRAKIICSYFNYLHDIGKTYYNAELKDIGNYLIHARCPDGVKFNSQNQVVLSEIQVRNHLSLIADFYKKQWVFDIDDPWDITENEILIDFFDNTKLSKALAFLNQMNENVLSLIVKREIKPFLANDEINNIGNSISDDLDDALFAMTVFNGLNSDNFDYTQSQGFYQYISEKNKYFAKTNSEINNGIDEDVINIISEHKEELSKLTHKDYRKIIKKMSEQSGINFNENTLVKTFIRIAYEHKLSLVAISYICERKFEFILQTLQDVLNIPIGELKAQLRNEAKDYPNYQMIGDGIFERKASNMHLSSHEFFIEKYGEDWLD